MATVFKRGGKNNRGGTYYISWFDHTGKRRTKSARTTDKATAERVARKLEADAALRRDGVIDPTLDAISQQSKRTIEEHLEDYENKLRAANRTEKHVANTLNFIRWIAEYAGFRTAVDITADGVNRYAGKLRDEGRAARTIQAHLSAIKSFTKWLTENHKLPRDPLASVKKPDPKSSRRRERRMLLPEEWTRLEITTVTGPDRYGMSGMERLLLYRTAIQTGLRANELRSLTRGRLYIDADPPYITCGAGSTKNRKDARQYIQPELAEELRAHISTKAPRTPVFGLPHEASLAKMLREDLRAAREAWIAEAKKNPQEFSNRQQGDFLAETNHEGETTDFHCLRHTCGAWLAMTGAHPKVVQQVMRHQAITLTMDTYGHLFPGQEAEAISRMRQLLGTPRDSMEATGTDDAAANSRNQAQRQAQQTGRKTLHGIASGCENTPTDSGEDNKPNLLLDADVSDTLREDATEDKNTPGRTRTCNLRIRSPLLYPVELRALSNLVSVSVSRCTFGVRRFRSCGDRRSGGRGGEWRG